MKIFSLRIIFCIFYLFSSVQIHSDSLAIRTLYGKNTGEQTTESLNSFYYFDSLQTGTLKKMYYDLENGYDFRSERTFYKKDYSYYGLELDYEKSAFTFHGFFKAISKYTSIGNSRTTRDYCQFYKYPNCSIKPFQVNLQNLNFDDNSFRVVRPQIFWDSNETSKAYLNENTMGILTQYYPFTKGDDKYGFSLVFGLKNTQTQIKVKNTFYHNQIYNFTKTPEYQYIFGQNTFYSGQIWELPLGLGYKIKIIDHFTLDGWLCLTTGTSIYKSQSIAPTSITNSESKQFLNGKGFLAQIRLSYNFENHISIGAGFSSHHYYSEGYQKLRGGNLDNTLVNEITSLMKLKTSPAYIGIKDNSIEIFASKKFMGL